MNVLVVYAHHESSSLTASLKNAGISALQAQGHTVVESDLYAMGFSAVANTYDFSILSGQHINYMLEQKHATQNSWGYSPDIVSEMQKVQAADMIIFYTPIWWFSVPAILKGWFDRVLTMGFAWDSGKIYEAGPLRGKNAHICLVAGGPEEYYQPLGRHKATIRQIFHPVLHGTFAFCGLDVLEPYTVFGAVGLSGEQAQLVVDDHRASILASLEQPRYISKFE